MTHKQLYTLGALGLGLITLGAGATLTAQAHPAQTAAMTQAIQNKDLAAFKSAMIQDATDKANSITQEEFTKISEQYTKQQAVQKAIDEKNYEAFKAAADEKMLQRVNSQVEFYKLVARNEQQKATQAKVLETVKNNDFNAYKTVIAEEKAQMEANKPADSTNTNRPARPEPTEAQMKTRFDELVKYYQANGKLPEKGFGMIGEGMGKNGRGPRM
jgi:hypothetical protein